SVRRGPRECGRTFGKWGLCHGRQFWGRLGIDAGVFGRRICRHGAGRTFGHGRHRTRGRGTARLNEESPMKKALSLLSIVLLGLAFHPTTGELLVLDFGLGNVLRVDPQTGASSVFSPIGPTSGLNALTFDSAGNVYVSDSFQGIIWRIPAAGGAATPWVTDPLLTTTGKPPF